MGFQTCPRCAAEPDCVFHSAAPRQVTWEMKTNERRASELRATGANRESNYKQVKKERKKQTKRQEKKSKKLKQEGM